MKKEGAFEKDGKYMIDEDYSEWKKVKEAMTKIVIYKVLRQKYVINRVKKETNI